MAGGDVTGAGAGGVRRADLATRKMCRVAPAQRRRIIRTRRRSSPAGTMLPAILPTGDFVLHSQIPFGFRVHVSVTTSFIFIYILKENYYNKYANLKLIR